MDIYNQDSSVLKNPRRRRPAKGKKIPRFKLVVRKLFPVLGENSCVMNQPKGHKLVVPPPAKTIIPLGGIEVLDCRNKFESMAVFGVPADGPGDKTFLCWKAPRMQSIGAKNGDKYRKTFQTAFKLKPNIDRGKKHFGSTDRYICFGMRKNPKNSGIGSYAFNPMTNEIDQKLQENILISVGKLCYQLEKVTSSFTKLLPDDKNFKTLQCEYGLPRAFANHSKAAADGERAAEANDDITEHEKCAAEYAGYATQFSVGKNYWSKLHTDDDYFYTSLSCLSADAQHSGEILYHFVFPSYNVAVPMRSGDILLFNPRILHGCTNPSREGAFIFSAYVSAKTVNTVVSKNDN